MNKLFLLFPIIFAFASPSTSAQSPCSGPNYQQFDFWVGNWEVFHAKADTIVGVNRVEKILNDCVVMENWTGATGFQGKSFNTYSPIDSTWNQVWVDVGGATYHFKGKWEQESMRLKGKTMDRNGHPILFKMSYTPDKNNGNVRQVWKQSTDNGENWAIIFDGIYKQSKKTSND